jgi:hypothetical protein
MPRCWSSREYSVQPLKLLASKGKVLLISRTAKGLRETSNSQRLVQLFQRISVWLFWLNNKLSRASMGKDPGLVWKLVHRTGYCEYVVLVLVTSILRRWGTSTELVGEEAGRSNRWSAKGSNQICRIPIILMNFENIVELFLLEGKRIKSGSGDSARHKAA